MTHTNQENRTRQDWKLLRQWIDKGIESAFNELVRRYANLVYSVCLRDLPDRQAAEDAAQAVFIVFARKAPAFREGIVLTTWLYTVARLTCRNARREQRRREARERMAAQEQAASTANVDLWNDLSPLLHETIDALPRRDRDLILLRFFDQLSLREVGAALNLSEDTTRVAVNRAVERMRTRLARQGIVIGAAALATVIGSRAVEASPGGLTVKLMPSNLPGSVTPHVGHLAKGAIRSMKLAQMRTVTIITVSLVVAGAVVTIALPSGNGPLKQAVTRAPKTSDPKAVALLRTTENAYGRLSSYSDVEIGSGAGSQTEGIPDKLVIEYRRPDQFTFLATTYNQTRRTTADAQYTYTVGIPASTQSVNPAPAPVGSIPVGAPGIAMIATPDQTAVAVDQGKAYLREPAHPSGMKWPGIWLAAGLANNGPTDFVLKALDPVIPIWHAPQAVVYFGNPIFLDGTLCDTVLFAAKTPSGPYADELAIGRSDHLLRRYRTYLPPDGQQGEIDASILYNDVKANPSLPDSDFAFVPPPGATRIDSGLEHDIAAENIIQAMYDTYNRMRSYHCTESMTTHYGHIDGVDPNALPDGSVRNGTADYTIDRKNGAILDITETRTDAPSKIHIVVHNGRAFAEGQGPEFATNMYLRADVHQIDESVNLARDMVTNLTYVQDDWMPAVPLGWDMRPAHGGYDFKLEKPTTVDGLPVDVVFEPQQGLTPTGSAEPDVVGDRLYIGRDDHLLHRLELVNWDGDKSVNTTTCTFDNIKVNPDIPSAAFDFHPSQGRTPTPELMWLLKRFHSQAQTH